MAKIGLKKPMYCTITGDNEALGVGKSMAKAIKADLKIKTSDIKMYADDSIDENIKEFIDGELSQELNEIDDDVAAEILGNEISADGELTANANDVSPFLRVGFIVRRVKSNVVTYRAIVLMKVKYGIPDESYETKGENTAFKSTTIVGTIYRNKDGDWKKQKTCSTEAEAVTYLKTMLNANIPTLTVTSVAGATTGTTKLTVTPAKGASNSYKYIVGTALVLPNVNEICTTGYTAWDGTADITATTGKEIMVVEVDTNNKAVKAGKATVVSKA